MGTQSDQPDNNERRPLPIPPARPPIQVVPLGYYRQEIGKAPKPAVPVVVQFLCGFILLNVCVVVGTLAAFHDAQNGSGAVVEIGLIGVSFIFLCAFLRGRVKWTGFVPGALTGLLAAPVTFFFACASQIHF